MLISEAHLELNRKLHEDPFFGAGGYKDVKLILDVIKKSRVHTILDYGSGKCSLKNALYPYSIKVKCYEPAFDIDERSPCDLVICRNVLPHIEPGCLNEVLKDIHRLTKKRLYARIGTYGGEGRVIIQNQEWWLDKLGTLFDPIRVTPGPFRFDLEAKPC